MASNEEKKTSSLDEVANVLSGQRKKLYSLNSGIQELHESNDENSDRIDGLIARVSSLVDGLGLPAESINFVPKVENNRLADLDLKTRNAALVISWDELSQEYIGPSSRDIELDMLLPPDVVAEIDKKLEETVSRESWKKWGDFYAVAAAGLAGAVFDLFLSNKIFFRPEIHRAISHSKQAIDFPVGGGNAHRTIGAGHDIFRFSEARKMLIEGKFEAVFRDGKIFSTAYKYAGKEIPYTKIPPEAASNALIMHWVADFFSARSIPIPGWSYLTEHDGRAADFALESFQNGMNLRGMLSNMSGVVLTGLILRFYFYIAQYSQGRDVDWRLARNVKYQEMALVAQSINLLVNAGKVALTKNLYAINVPAIVAVIRHLAPVLLDVRHRHSLAGIVQRNRTLIDANWDCLDQAIADEAGHHPATRELLERPVIHVG